MCDLLYIISKAFKNNKRKKNVQQHKKIINDNHSSNARVWELSANYKINFFFFMYTKINYYSVFFSMLLMLMEK